MSNAHAASMAEALRLTRAGRLAEASGVIRAALTGSRAASSAAPIADGDIIDLKPERVTVTPRPGEVREEPAAAAAAPTPARPSGAGGTFEERSYSGPAGRLSYMLYVPAGAKPGMPLIVMLHGCTQTPEDFACGTAMNRLADAHGVLVAYPRQTRAANPQGCWNWFRPGDQRRDAGEPALIAGATRAVIAEEGADPARVYVAGLSAGGAAAAIMAAAYPDLYAAVGIHSGLASGAASDLPSALAAMRQGAKGKASGAGAGKSVPVITFHGDRDNVVHEKNAAEIIAGATAGAVGPLRTRTETGRSAGGRGYTRELSVDERGQAVIERWTVHGAGHAWAGGNAAGSYTDPRGPDASREMLRFFLSHAAAGMAAR